MKIRVTDVERLLGGVPGRRRAAGDEPKPPPFPGIPEALDGSTAIVEMETAASEAAGAYPITPSTQMGEGWAAAVAAGATNVHGRRLLFFEPEGEHAAAAVTAGMSLVGLRATNFSSGQGIAYMHESLYAAVGKRLTYVLNVAARAMTKHALNVHAGHDDYHAVDDTGFFQLFAKDVQSSADLNLIAHRIAELALNPGLVAQDGFLTSHVIESIRLPERDLVKRYLGDPADLIPAPTPAQRLVFGEVRRRIPELYDFDYPAMLGTVQNQDSYAQGVAAQRPFYFDHVRDLTDRAMAEYAELTGRSYQRAMGYRLEDAEYVLAGQGSVVSNAEAVADHLREERGLKVGILDLVMFRPFPADLVTRLLRGKGAVTVLERTDQPLAVDAPLLREIRAAMSQGVENHRAARAAGRGGRRGATDPAAPPGMPFPGLEPIAPEEVPDFHSAGFGFGSRDLQPGDLVAAVENMLPGGRGRRQFYLGVDFLRKGTRLPKLQIWQERLEESYPHLADLAIGSAGDLDLMPKGSISIRIHSVGGWGAITMGKNLALTAYELAGLHIKANPKYGSEKKGQPTTFYATLAREPIRLNSELKHVDVVLSPDGNVFRHSDPLAGLAGEGVFVIQSDLEPTEVWRSLPPEAQRTVVERGVRVFALDGFRIASEEASDPELRYRMQGAAFMGAFFAVSPLMEREGLDEARIFEGIEEQLRKKFGKLGDRVVQDNLRVIRRGFEAVRPVEPAEVSDVAAETPAVRAIPPLMDVPEAGDGLANPGRFWEQVCAVCQLGQDIIADPFAGISAIPAASSSIRDMTGIRFEVPDFIPEKCTGCSQCWVQCPDAAIPGLVNTVEDLLETAIRTAGTGRAYGGAPSSNGKGGQAVRTFDRLRQISPHLSREANKVLKSLPFKDFGEVLATAYRTVAGKLGWDPERMAQLDDEFAAIHSILSEFPVAKTGPFFDVPESKAKGTGGLLSITINPEACKGCNICVDVCPEQALITVKQTDEVVDRLRRNWELWQALPDTADRYINVGNLEEGIGVLSSTLLRKGTYRSMVGGDGACMGCGEKTAVHLVVSAIEAVMRPRVKAFVGKLEELIAGLEERSRELLSSEADVDAAGAGEGESVAIAIAPATKAELRRLTAARRALQDLLWRYVEGPGGRGRANLGITNSTGCSSVWGSTYPFNPYPYPWVNHLFQDAPSIAIGVFEGHMRKMADAFAAVRRAELILAGEYAPEENEEFFTGFEWRQFTDEEFDLCPPIMAVGGDGAMLDIGFQNLSRLLASGKPIRVLVLDTQVYSNTGGQACTSGFTGQVADMSAYGKAQHGKEEVRKELSLIALAHRGTYVLQSSQALPSHLMAGVIKGLKGRRPAIFNIYTPCPVEHGLPDEWAPHAAKLALEARAFPFLVYDPSAGESFADCLSLEGNPALDEDWPTYTLEYADQDGARQRLELPLTVADWAATEARFKKHFKPVADDAEEDALVPFHEFVALDESGREGRTPFIHVAGAGERLGRLQVSREMVRLAEDRLLLWHQLRELAGERVASAVRDRLAAELEAEFEERAAALKSDYDARLAELQATYPGLVARRIAEGLIRGGNGNRTVADLLEAARTTPGLQPTRFDPGAGAAPTRASLPAPAAAPAPGAVGGPEVGGAAAAPQPAAPPVEAGEPAPTDQDESDELVMEPYIETARCTTCNECTNINSRLFAYDENKQAYIKDARAGTFAQIVTAAERCPVDIIHPGTPLNPREKDLEKWVERARPFN